MKSVAFGGVVIREDGKVLLREPTNHFDGYVWTFPKGRPDPDEEPQAAAIREVFEETGYVCEVVEKIPGVFKGGTTVNEYFLMTAQGEPQSFGLETESIAWAPQDEAEQLIARSTSLVGRNRDLLVLRQAFKQWKAHKHERQHSSN